MRSIRRTLGIAAAAGLLAAAAAAGAEVADSAESVQPLLVGAQAPDITVRSLDGEEVALKDILAKQRSVLVFYRGGW